MEKMWCLGLLHDCEAPWNALPIDIAFRLDLGWRFHLVRVTIQSLRPACGWHFSGSDKVFLCNHRPPPSLSLLQLSSSKLSDPGVVLSLLAVSDPGGLVHFESSPCQAWLGSWKYMLPSCVGVGEFETLHDPSHVHCLFEPHCKPGSRSRRRPGGIPLACGLFGSWCVHRWGTMSKGGVVSGSCVPVTCDNQHVSCGNSVDCVLRLLSCVEHWGIDCYDGEVHCRPLKSGTSKTWWGWHPRLECNLCGPAESDCHAMPSGIVYYSTVVEVIAIFLTRHLGHWVITVGYFDFQKTSNIQIVLTEFPHACAPTSWRVRTFQYSTWRSSSLRKTAICNRRHIFSLHTLTWIHPCSSWSGIDGCSVRVCWTFSFLRKFTGPNSPLVSFFNYFFNFSPKRKKTWRSNVKVAVKVNLATYAIFIYFFLFID